MIKNFFIAVGEYCLFLKKVFRKPEKWRIFWRQFINESDKLILSSILLVGVISVFIGGVLVIQPSITFSPITLTRAAVRVRISVPPAFPLRIII